MLVGNILMDGCADGGIDVEGGDAMVIVVGDIEEILLGVGEEFNALGTLLSLLTLLVVIDGEIDGDEDNASIVDATLVDSSTPFILRVLMLLSSKLPKVY